MTMTPKPLTDVVGAKALAVFGDSITTDHISPAGAIKADSPAAPTSAITRSRAPKYTAMARAAATTR